MNLATMMTWEYDITHGTSKSSQPNGLKASFSIGAPHTEDFIANSSQVIRPLTAHSIPISFILLLVRSRRRKPLHALVLGVPASNIPAFQIHEARVLCKSAVNLNWSGPSGL